MMYIFVIITFVFMLIRVTLYEDLVDTLFDSGPVKAEIHIQIRMNLAKSVNKFHAKECSKRDSLS